MEAIQSFIHQLTRMQWSDYLDIAVVAFLVYKLLPLIRAPGTMRIAKAVIALMVVAGLAAVLRLYTVSFILNQFMAVGLLALVILFQPELRRMLDRLGVKKMLWIEAGYIAVTFWVMGLMAGLLAGGAFAAGSWQTCRLRCGPTARKKPPRPSAWASPPYRTW